MHSKVQRSIFQKFNELFWNEELGFYAYTLDGDHFQPWPLPLVRHCPQGPRRTPGGAVDAARHVERLGIRTLSASGAVWPHDNAIIALDFRHYGFAAEAGGRKFTSQVAEIATTWAGSVTLWIRVNNSYNLLPGVTQNRARTVLLPTFL